MSDSSNRPLWLFLAEPGLGPTLLKELKHRDIVGAKARAQTRHLRNYDLLVLPDVQMRLRTIRARIALEAMECPVFGRHRIGDRQLDWLAEHAKKNHCDGIVSSVAGTAFQRQDVMRWLVRGLKSRGVGLVEEPARPIRLFIIDESFYFGFSRFNYHDLPGRVRNADRQGSLPVTIAAAMCFLANPGAEEIVWDPVVGTGTLLIEAAGQMAGATLIGSDIDGNAISRARANLAGIAEAELVAADAGALDLQRTDVTLTLANLPFGKQFGSPETNAGLYERILRRSLMHAAPHWRAILLTSDEAALGAAADAVGGLAVERLAATRIRGHEADIKCLRRA